MAKLFFGILFNLKPAKLGIIWLISEMGPVFVVGVRLKLWFVFMRS